MPNYRKIKPVGQGGIKMELTQGARPSHEHINIYRYKIYVYIYITLDEENMILKRHLGKAASKRNSKITSATHTLTHIDIHMYIKLFLGQTTKTKEKKRLSKAASS